jgi:hypothetical protein
MNFIEFEWESARFSAKIGMMSAKHTRQYRMTKLPDMRRRNWYSGYAHYAFTVGFALCIGAYSYSQIQRLAWVHLFWVMGMVVYANAVEYFVHRGPLHHRIKGLGILFERHGVQHHHYFTERDITIKSHLEMTYVLFPAIAIVVFIPLVAGPMATLIGLGFGSDTGWVALATSVFYFAWYETFHLANHLPRHHWVHRIPGISALCFYHRTHHAPENAKRYNFNVTFPLVDWFMGTLKK